MWMIDDAFDAIIASAEGLLAFGTPGVVTIASMLAVLTVLAMASRAIPGFAFLGGLAFLAMGIGVAMYAEALREDAGCIARDFAEYREIAAQRTTAIRGALGTTRGKLDELSLEMIRQADANVVYATPSTANQALVLSGSRNMLHYSHTLRPLVEQLHASDAALAAVVPFSPGCDALAAR